jgi:hypothetical protein
MATVLFTRSNHDIASAYLAAYGQRLIDYAEQQGHTIHDLYGDQATTENFETAIQTVNPNIVIMQGHGNATTMTGQDLQPLVKLGVNDNCMSGKAAYLWACATGAQLGPALVENTCQAYGGYQSDFVFIYSPDHYEAGQLLDDPWAQPFFDCGLATGYGFLAGETPLDVYNLTMERYDYWWQYWLQQSDPMTDDILTWLHWNRQGFIVITPDGIYAKTPVKLSLPPLLLPIVGASVAFYLLATDKT